MEYLADTVAIIRYFDDTTDPSLCSEQALIDERGRDSIHNPRPSIKSVVSIRNKIPINFE